MTFPTTHQPKPGQFILIRLINDRFVLGTFIRRYEQEKNGPLWTLTVNHVVQSFAESSITAWSPQ